MGNLANMERLSPGPERNIDLEHTYKTLNSTVREINTKLTLENIDQKELKKQQQKEKERLKKKEAKLAKLKEAEAKAKAKATAKAKKKSIESKKCSRVSMQELPSYLYVQAWIDVPH